MTICLNVAMLSFTYVVSPGFLLYASLVLALTNNFLSDILTSHLTIPGNVIGVTTDKRDCGMVKRLKSFGFTILLVQGSRSIHGQASFKKKKVFAFC